MIKCLLLIFSILSQTSDCKRTSEPKNFLPETLPSESVIRNSLESVENLEKIRFKAHELNITIEEWKQREKKNIREAEIQKYWQKEKMKTEISEGDFDLLQKKIDSIRTRLAWTRIFHATGLQIPFDAIRKDSEFFSKLDTVSTPNSGSPNSRITIVEWRDYQCGYCKKSFRAFENLPIHFRERIRWYYKDFPLNPDSEENLLPLLVSRCLFEKHPERYRDFIKYLYKLEKSTGEFLDLSSECSKDIYKNKYKKALLQDRKEAESLGIGSIPFYWINGQFVRGALSEDAWKELLSNE